MLEPQISNNINCFNTNISFHNYTVAEERSEILAWLSPLEPQSRHQDIRTRRASEVGDWVLQTEEYQNWFGGIRGGKSGGSALLCHGGPGVGKTYISSLVIDTLCKQVVGGGGAVACFYFDFANQEEQSPAAILGSVLKQVVGGLNEVPERIAKAFRDREKVIGGLKLELAEIVEFLQDMASSRPTFICIDALDECPPAHRVKLLDSINQILQNSPGARIFLTGRQHILGEVDKHLAGRVATRSITPTKDDIIIFLRAKLKEDTMPDAMDKRLEKEIIDNISKSVSEVFLLVFLSIKTILQEATIYRRRQRLSAMKNGLDLGGAYGATLGRIKAQGGEKARLGMAVLMWISHSRRPLQVDELCHAVAIRIGSDDLDSDDIPAISTLLDCCQGLVTVDKGASTVRLIHFTLQEYLCTHPGLFEKTHSTMAETCLTYLNFQHVNDLPDDLSHDPRDTPFLEYCSLYWGTHMRMVLSDRAKAFALRLLCHFDSHISAKSLWKSINDGLRSEYYSEDQSFSALHCISYFGIPEVTHTLIKMNRWDVNQRDGAGMTPLIWAARYGHEEVVNLLLQEKHVQPDQQDTGCGRTALSWAAENGHEGVVRFFLGPGFVNPESIGRRLGKVRRVVGLLFGRECINPDSPSESGRTPLSWAAGNGHEGTVMLLLGREDVDPNTLDTEYGRTPLSWAARNRHEGIVKLLLVRKDVNPEIPDTKYGLTPLSWASGSGHEGIVKLLLGRKDVNPDTPDTIHGLTPLSWAARSGHEEIVKLLLRRKDVNPDNPSKSGRTPLSWAARSGHEVVVKLLLERKDVNPSTLDTKYGQTPLSWAARSGHEGTVKLLLERKDVNPDSSCKSGRTLLWWAVRNAHEGVLKLLLEREDVNPDNTSESGRTPLSWAAEMGYEGIVKLLLGRKDVNPDSLSKYGRTPLSLAAANGHEGIVRLLLRRKDVSPDSSTIFDQTPLMLVVDNPHDRFMELLQADIFDTASTWVPA